MAKFAAIFDYRFRKFLVKGQLTVQMDPKTRKKRARQEQNKIAGNMTWGVAFVWLLILVLVGRYGYLQLVEGDRLAERVRVTTGEGRVIQSTRGQILDRTGHELATSLMMKSLFIDPNNVRDPYDVASKLAPLIGMTEDEILDDIAQGGGFVWVKHYLSTDEVDAVKHLNQTEEYNCLGFQDEPNRYYPNGMLAANVLGFVGTDDIGLDGIEQAYDDMMKGDKRETFIKMDNASGDRILDSIFTRGSYKGNQCKTIELTIDATMQFMVEEALDDAMVDNNPVAVTAVVMNPKNGDVLAMASRPSYDPNHFDDYPMENWQNRAVSRIYEPGSTFKSIVAAAALEEGVVAPNDWFLDPGVVEVSERRIQNADGERFGSVTFADIVAHSINTGFALIGLDLGADRLTSYAKKFGFGEQTGIELPAEEAGILFDPDEMRDSDIATMAIGQSIAVTPLQLVRAMSAIANDGILMKPHIVKAIRNADGSIYYETHPEEVRRVITSVTDKTLIGLLEGVVTHGGGKKAAVKGYRIAGKTGTAQKIKPDGAGYMDGHYIASFCGFAPVEDPQITVLVIVDDPSGIYYGGQVAAPVASRIFKSLLRYLKVEPSSDPFAASERTTKPTINENSTKMESVQVIVPEVIGLDAVDARRQLEAVGLVMESEGQGRAVSQSISPNVVVPRGTVVAVRFAPEAPSAASGNGG